jgi:IS30 family transposase
VVLADRGSEFSDAQGIEASDILADKKCRLYYCDPRRGDQKARCENAHRLIRRVLPKGTSFEGLTDEAVSLLTSHVNSVPRKSLGGKPPCSRLEDMTDSSSVGASSM